MIPVGSIVGSFRIQFHAVRMTFESFGMSGHGSRRILPKPAVFSCRTTPRRNVTLSVETSGEYMITIPPCSRLCVVTSNGRTAVFTPHGAGACGAGQCCPDVGGSDG